VHSEVIQPELNCCLRNFQIHVAIATTKKMERIERFLGKATEIGINRETPILCHYSERKDIKTERLDKVMVSAMR
jgi:16S rRNA (uracil1498-N3)-methyltransferase